MDAVEYEKTKYRLCRSKDSCFECPLQDKENCGCIADTIEYVENAVPIVEQWAKEHPVKTRQSEFLKQFPNAQLNKDGVLVIDPCKIDTNSKEDDKCEALKTGMYSCSDCRKKYWLTEVTDND